MKLNLNDSEAAIVLAALRTFHKRVDTAGQSLAENVIERLEVEYRRESIFDPTKLAETMRVSDKKYSAHIYSPHGFVVGMSSSGHSSQHSAITAAVAAYNKDHNDKGLGSFSIEKWTCRPSDGLVFHGGFVCGHTWESR